jgi:hypothetical protein
VKRRRVSGDRLHLHDLGTRIDQQLAAIPAGDPIADLYDT